MVDRKLHIPNEQVYVPVTVLRRSVHVWLEDGVATKSQANDEECHHRKLQQKQAPT